MERISGKRAGILAAAVAGFLAKDASADKFPLELTEPRDHLAEILRVEGPSIVDTRIDKTRKSVRVAASPGSPVNVQIGCPSDWNLDGADWALDAGPPKPENFKYGIANGTLPSTGVYNASLLAPLRVGETQIARLGCVRDDDREDLAVAVTAVAGAPDPDDDPLVGDFSHRDWDDIPILDRPSRGPGVPVELAGSMFMVDDERVFMADGDPGGIFSAKIDPVDEGPWAHVPVGVAYRFGKIHEDVNALDGSTKEVSGWSHCGFVGGGWNPILANTTVDVRAEVEGAIGICGAQAIKTGPTSEVPEVRDIALRGAVGIQVGGKHLAVRAGIDGVRSDVAALQNWGLNMGFLVRF